jgi:predicted nucleic acid-binding protein
VDGYLLDTCAISALLDDKRDTHINVKSAVDGFEKGAPQYVSCVTLAELTFGILLDEAATGNQNVRALEMLRQAKEYPIREITLHTIAEYAELRKNLAVTFLRSYIRSNRPRWIDLWIDRATNERLGIDENDLWICAQARQYNLTLLTTDGNMVDRMGKADQTLKFCLR